MESGVPTHSLTDLDFYQEESPFQRLRSQTQTLVATAVKFLPIQTAEEYQQCVDLGRVLQASLKEYEEIFRPVKRAMDAKKNEVLTLERQCIDSVIMAKERLSRVVQEYDDRQKAEAAYRDAQAAKEPVAVDPEMPLPPPVITQLAVQPKTKGKVVRNKARAKVENFPELVKAVTNGIVPYTALLPNQAWLDKRADADRETMAIPGVTFEEERKVHFRS